MSEHDLYVAERLRAADIPHLDTASVVAGATLAGRRSVRRRRIGTALASVTAVALVGAGASAQLTTSSAPAPDVATTADPSPTESPTPDAGSSPVPYGGSWFSFIAEEVTDREVGRIGDVEPVPTDAPSPTPGAEDEVSLFLQRDHPQGRFALDGIITNVAITWGTDQLTPEEAELHNRTLPEELAGVEFTANGYGTDTLTRCRALHEKGTDHRPGTCRSGPDGTAWVAYRLRLGPDAENPRTWEVRGAVVYQPDEWVLDIEQRSGGGYGEPPYLEKMASPEELYRILRDGEWFR